MADQEQELFKLHRQGQDKYAYFLLAAAGAAIGLALTQTKDAALGFDHVLLGLAASCWGASFLAGCYRLNLIDAGLYNNSVLLQIRRGQHPQIGTHPEMIQAGVKGILIAMEGQSDGAMRWGKAQSHFLVSGAGLYIAWHILEMYLRRA